MKPIKQMISDYSKPVPKKWRQIGDTALVLAIAVEPMVQTIPLQNELQKEWFSWVFNTALIIFKIYTNTKTISQDEQV